MQVLHGDAGRQLFPQKLCVVQHIFRLDHLALLYHGTDDVGLAPGSNFPGNELICLVPVPGVYHTVFDRQTLSRHLINDRNIQVSIQNDSQSPGNRSGTHNQHMRCQLRIMFTALVSQGFPLPYAEPVLLIGNDQSQPVIMHFFLDQGMSSHYDICLVGSNLFVGQTLFLCRHGTCHQNHLLLNPVSGKQTGNGFVVLLCQDLGRRHQSPLTSVHGRFQKGQYCHNGFSGAYIALYQTVHDQSAFQIPPHLFQNLFLGTGQLIGQRSQELIDLR